MPDQPVDDHSEEFEELASLVALRVLDGDDLARFEQHADHCQRCRLMVRLDRQVLAAVSLVAPPMDPSPDFKQRLMQRAAAELAQAAATVPTTATKATPLEASPSENPQAAETGVTAPGPEGVPTAGTRYEPTPFRRRGNVVPLWRRTSWIAALAAVLVVGLAGVGAYSYENQPVATYTLNATAAGSVPGNASVVVRRSGMADLEMTGVPDPGPGYVYEAWIIPANTVTPIAAGITSTGSATVPLAGDLRGATVAITREQGRVDAPTTPVLLAAVVAS